MAIRLKIGDCFEIPLGDGRLAYCQHVSRNPELGFLVQVFDRLLPTPIGSVDELRGLSLLFPPVFVGLQATARSGRWRRIGNFAVIGFLFPMFRQTIGTKPGTYYDWTIWDGQKTKRIGTLPIDLRALELKCVWGDEALEERIVNGTYRGDKML
jgi:hypothetical protein